MKKLRFLVQYDMLSDPSSLIGKPVRTPAGFELGKVTSVRLDGPAGIATCEFEIDEASFPLGMEEEGSILALETGIDVSVRMRLP